MWRMYNPNPSGAKVGDCTVRAISKAMEQSWEKTYIDLCSYGLIYCDMPSANHVCGKYLHDNGYQKQYLPDNLHDNCTVDEFARKHNKGRYVAILSGHFVAIIDGDYYDTWDSGSGIILYYWKEM